MRFPTVKRFTAINFHNPQCIPNLLHFGIQALRPSTSLLLLPACLMALPFAIPFLLLLPIIAHDIVVSLRIAIVGLGKNRTNRRRAPKSVTCPGRYIV